ncbi:hypothetical protein C7R88_10220 [Plesiomonas shigelloides]|nr:hypothetical protein C7R88_10220 [Plesiomonas shigelloides]
MTIKVISGIEGMIENTPCEEAYTAPPTSLLQTGGWPAKFVVPIIKQCLSKAKSAVKKIARCL